MNYFRFLFSLKLRKVLSLQLFLVGISPAMAQEQEQKKGLEIYGYIKTDLGFNFNQIDPNWFDVLRVTKLPQYKDQFAPVGKFISAFAKQD